MVLDFGIADQEHHLSRTAEVGDSAECFSSDLLLTTACESGFKVMNQRFREVSSAELCGSKNLTLSATVSSM